MSLDLTLPSEFDADETVENFPKYCDYCKFLLVEELCLQEDYRFLHYGQCSVIGKIYKTVEHDVFLENVRITNLPNEFSLPEGSLNIRLLTYSYYGTQLQNNKYVEVTGESVLFQTKNPPQDNRHINPTSRGLLEQLSLTNNEEQYNKLLKYYQENYKPAILVWVVQPINRAGDLIQRNLELRMLQEQIL